MRQEDGAHLTAQPHSRACSKVALAVPALREAFIGIASDHPAPAERAIREGQREAACGGWMTLSPRLG